MQFPILALLGSLLAVTQAAPSSEQFTLSLSGGEGCYALCLSVVPKCGQGWRPTRFGTCWTCCSLGKNSNAADPPKDLVSEEATIFDSLEKSPTSDGGEPICLLVCWYEKHECGGPWYAQKFGECWTCCRENALTPTNFDALKPNTLNAPVETNDDITIDVSINVHGQDSAFTGREICWAACISEKPNCAPEGTARQLSKECWTCCFPNPENVVSSIDADQHLVEKEDYSLTFNNEASPNEICWRTCFNKKKTCPPNARAKQIDKCWTCCFDRVTEEL